MRPQIRLYLVLLVAAAVLLVARVAPAGAAGASISLTTSPVVLNLALQPGTSDTRTLQLMNNSSTPLQITMQLDVFSARGNTGDAIITAPLSSDPSVTWVSFSPSSFTAKPGVWSPVKMTINLPKTASLGYYYAVLFKPDVPEQPAADTTMIRGTNAILVLVDTHSGNEDRSLSIAGFSASQGLYEYLPATFTVTLRNNGNIYTAPTGNIYISKKSDGTNSLAALDINPSEGNILPHTTRDYLVNWSDGFPVFTNKQIDGQTVDDSHGNPVQVLSWNFAGLNKIRFGHYYAKLVVIYNDGQRVIPLTQVISFWVIPWKLILATIVVLIVLVVGLLTIGRFLLRPLRRKRVYRM